MMRGENCMEASVSVISNIAKNDRDHGHDRGRDASQMTCATCGSEMKMERAPSERNQKTRGLTLRGMNSTAPKQPSVSVMIRGRTRNPPRRLYANLPDHQWDALVHSILPVFLCSFDRPAPIPIAPWSRTAYCRMLRNVPMLSLCRHSHRRAPSLATPPPDTQTTTTRALAQR